MDVALTVERCVVPRVLFKDSTRMAHVFLEAEGEEDDQEASKDTNNNIIANWGTWGEDYN